MVWQFPTDEMKEKEVWEAEAQWSVLLTLQFILYIMGEMQTDMLFLQIYVNVHVNHTCHMAGCLLSSSNTIDSSRPLKNGRV